MTASSPTRAIYSHRPLVRCLRTMPFAPYANVPVAVSDPAFAVPPPEETAMLVFDGTEVLALNLVSAFVWDLLDGKHSLEDIVTALVVRFGVNRPTARRDVAQLCETVAQHNLVTVRQSQDHHRA